MGSIVEKIDRVNKEARQELMELLDKSIPKYRGHLLEGSVEDQDGNHEYLYNLCDGYIVKKIKSDHGYKKEILKIEQFVYGLSLEQVRDVAELLNIALDF